MKIIINPRYNYLAEFINNLPYTEPVPEIVYQNRRNYVYKVNIKDTSLVVKKYKRPTLVNCVIYTWFRTGKAERSYEYAFKLKDMGLDTAEPVAYIIQKKLGFLHTCYYISEYLPHSLLGDCVEYDRNTLLNIVYDLAEYTYNLHKDGVYHYDYSLGNIMFHKEGDKYRFTVLDINRVVFGYKRDRKRIKGLKRLGLPLPLFGVFIERYTQLAGLQTDLFFGTLLLRRGIHISGRVKRRYKAFIKHIKNALFKIKHFRYARF